MQVRPDDFVSLRRRARDPAWELFHVELSAPDVVQRENLSIKTRFGIKRKARWRFISQLNLALRKIDRPAIETARSAGFESADV